MKKLWEGRLSGADSMAEEFNASIEFDRLMYAEDIEASTAHAKMLRKIGVLDEAEANDIVAGLAEVKKDIENGNFSYSNALEDIHTHVENALREKIGDTAGKLHTARSRNDQVNTDLRLYLKKHIQLIINELVEFERVLYEIASHHLHSYMPGYTHLQPAQPMSLSHLILAYFFMIDRDIDRFNECLKRTDVLSLGSGAFAGVNYDVDREFVRKELGFSALSDNAMDAVSSRDFAAEFLAAAAILFTSLSRIAEDFIIFSSNEYRFVELADEFSTGSSIMPNKKNPDMLELTRGKSGRVFGSLMSLLSTMKGLPSAYNKDLQEDKEPVFDTIKTVSLTVPVLRQTLATATFNKERMLAACDGGYISAVEIADYLVEKDVPFREAHNIVARIVKYASENGKTFKELSLAEYRNFYKGFDGEVYEVTEIKHSINKKISQGSTGYNALNEQLAAAYAKLENREK